MHKVVAIACLYAHLSLHHSLVGDIIISPSVAFYTILNIQLEEIIELQDSEGRLVWSDESEPNSTLETNKGSRYKLLDSQKFIP